MTSTTSDKNLPTTGEGLSSELDVAAVVAAVGRVLPQRRLGLHEPSLRGSEWQYVKDCLDSGWVSYAGQYVNKFEQMLQEATGARFAVATASGTAALHTALLICGVRAGDEVLIPGLTFVATANSVMHAGALPHLIDSETVSLGPDAGRLDEYLRGVALLQAGECRNRLTGRRIAAIVPMHAFGHPADMDAICAVADAWQIPVIEDAAESLGSTYKGRGTGTFGRVAAMSFNGNKIVTTGGGGAVLTNDAELARHAKHLTTTAKLPHKWEFNHDEVGYNYRMPSLNAALGCAQLEQLPVFLAEKRELAERYRQVLAGSADVDFLSEPVYARSNFWLNAILVKPRFVKDFGARDALLAGLNDAGYMARPAWTLMHRLPMYAQCPRMDLSVAEDIERRLINLPSSAGLV